MTKQKKELEDSIELCSQKLDRAEKLITGLGGEKARWSEIAADLLITLKSVVGDVLLSAAIIAYLGPFDIHFRKVSIHLLITYPIFQLANQRYCCKISKKIVANYIFDFFFRIFWLVGLTNAIICQCLGVLLTV